MATQVSAAGSPPKGLPQVLADNAALMREIRSQFTEVSLLSALADRRRRMDIPATPIAPAVPATPTQPQRFAGDATATRSPAAPVASGDPLSMLQALLASLPPQPAPTQHMYGAPASPYVQMPGAHMMPAPVSYAQTYAPPAYAPSPYPMYAPVPPPQPFYQSFGQGMHAAMPPPAFSQTGFVQSPGMPVMQAPAQPAPPSMPAYTGSAGAAGFSAVDAGVSDRIRESISRLEAATAEVDRPLTMAQLRSPAMDATVSLYGPDDPLRQTAHFPASIIRASDVSNWVQERVHAQTSPLTTPTMRAAASRALAAAVGATSATSPEPFTRTQPLGSRSLAVAVPSSSTTLPQVTRTGTLTLSSNAEMTTATGILASQSRAANMLSIARRHMLVEAGELADEPRQDPRVAAALNFSLTNTVRLASPPTVSSSIARSLAAGDTSVEPLTLAPSPRQNDVDLSNTPATAAAAPELAATQSLQLVPAANMNVAALTDKLADLQKRLAAIRTPNEQIAAEQAAAAAEAAVAELEQKLTAARTAAAAPNVAASSDATRAPVTTEVVSVRAPSQKAAAVEDAAQDVRLRTRQGTSYSEMLAAGVAAPGGALPEDVSAPASIVPAEEWQPGQEEAEMYDYQPMNGYAGTPAPAPAQAAEPSGFMSRMGRMIRKSFSFQPGSRQAKSLAEASMVEPQDWVMGEPSGMLPPEVVMGGEEVDDGTILKGNLMKCGSNYRFWHTRYCVLTATELIYFAKQADAEKEFRTGVQTRRGAVDLTAAMVFLGPGRAKSVPTAFPFRLHTGRRDFVFAAANEDVRMSWIGALVAVTHGDLNEVLAGTAYAPSALMASGVDIGEIDLDEDEDAVPVDLDNPDEVLDYDADAQYHAGAAHATDYSALAPPPVEDDFSIPRAAIRAGPPHTRHATSFRP